jgi:hypothetical protein
LEARPSVDGGLRPEVGGKDAQEVRTRCEQTDRKLNGLINSLRGTRGR